MKLIPYLFLGAMTVLYGIGAVATYKRHVAGHPLATQSVAVEPRYGGTR